MGFYDTKVRNFYSRAPAEEPVRNEVDLTAYKPISGFERYYVNKKGDIYDSVKNRFVSANPDTKGYLTVGLTDEDGKRHNKRVHIMVAEAFLEVPAELQNYRGRLVVDHKDCNKQNPNVENLHWVTQAENTRLAYKNNCRETVGRKIIDLNTKKIYNSATQASAELQVTRAAVTNCCIKLATCQGHRLRYLDEVKTDEGSN